ncbi:MAG: VCBS repeat-containing protein [Verrucomicrobiota bacterium]
MNPTFLLRRQRGWLAGILLACGLTGLAHAESTNGTFGFTGPEHFPIEQQISNLRCADLDGDGLLDVIVVNNARSKINLLYNQTGKTNRAPARTMKREANELPPDSRFRIESIASEKRIADLVVADLNGDGRPDLAYFGDPKELVVLYNQGSNGWSAPKRWQIEDGQLIPNCLATGDLNGDGLTDLLLLGENQIYVFLQKPDHTLGEPEKIPFTGTLKSVQVLDIDGDGREDLLLSNWDSPNPLRVRFQGAAGQLGPEIYFPMAPIRSYWADDLEQDHKTEIVTIALNSGRAAVSKFIRKPAEKLSTPFLAGQFQILPLNKSTKSKRGMLWADVNADGLSDLLVAEPDSGQLTIYLQQKDGTLAAGRTFSTLTGVSDLAVADWDGDGRPEIFLLSADERQVGVTRYDPNGRVAFPTLIPLEGRPLAITTARLSPKAKPQLAVIVEQDGKRSFVLRGADGHTRSQKLGENFKSNPASLLAHDLDQDGLMDFVVAIPYEKLKLLRQTDGGDFEETDLAPPGGAAEQPWLGRADVDGDGREELLLAQKNFLRAVVLKRDVAPNNGPTNWNFQVKEQINGAAVNSRIVAATALPKAGSPVPSLFLLDGEKKTLTLSERDASGAWQVTRSLPLPFTEFTELCPLGLGDAKPNSVGFLGGSTAAWLPLQGEVWELNELDGYETPIKDGRLSDVVTGDLNQDGRKDLVFLETARNYIDIVIYDRNGKLVPANRWQVFEERTFRGMQGNFPEPREAIIADFTGDGKNDLLILVHNRLLLYPQE